MLGHFACLVIAVELGVLGRDRDDLVVLLAGVEHGHQPNRPGLDDCQRHHRFLAEHQHIEGIVVFCECLRDEPIIRRIIDGLVKYTIEFDQAALLVQFVLHARAKRDLDDADEFPRNQLSGSDVVPCMNHVFGFPLRNRNVVSILRDVRRFVFYRVVAFLPANDPKEAPFSKQLTSSCDE